jgi:hypothetical protein
MRSLELERRDTLVRTVGTVVEFIGGEGTSNVRRG